MTRYYLIATLIVIAIGSIVFAHRLTRPDLRISAQPTGTPTVESPHAPDSVRGAASFSASGPWVLSALPACFEEQSRTRGPAEAVASKIPATADRIAPGTRLIAGTCTVIVRPSDLWVTRDADRLRVPHARLYRTGALLTLVTKIGTTTEIRIYRASPSF